MYNFFPDGFEPGEGDALFAWLWGLSLLAFQAMPYVFGLQSFLGWPVTDPKIWLMIGFGLATAFALSVFILLAVIDLVARRWTVRAAIVMPNAEPQTRKIQ